MSDPDDVLEANLRALFRRAYAPVRPSGAFRARLLRELDPAETRVRRLWVAAAALLLAVLGLALHFAFPGGSAPAAGSRLRFDRQAWRPLSAAEAARGVEYAQGMLELELAPQRAGERIWVGAHGAVQLEQAAQVALSGGASAPRIELASGRARCERVESGGEWILASAGVEFALESGALRLERQARELRVRLESGSATYGPARDRLPARRELLFRDGLLVGTPPALDETGGGGTRSPFPAAHAPTEPPAPTPALSPALRLRGRVLGPDGAPWSGECTLVALREERLPEVSTPVARTFRDAQGAFEFPLARRGRYTLFVLAAGTATLHRAGLEPALEPAALELRLEAGIALRGRVVDAASGAPLAGATVVSEDDAPTQVLALETADLPAELSARARTDAEGRFVLERLSRGRHTLRAGAPGHAAAWSARLEADSAPEGLELALGLGGTIEVQLEPPRGGVPLIASAVDYSFQRPCLSYAVGRSDALGRARFEHLPPGPFVVLQADAASPSEVRYTFVREGASSSVHLGPVPTDHALDGRLLDAAGNPLPNVDLMLQSADPGSELWSSRRTDAGGRFHFDGVRSGVYSFFVGDLGRNFVELERIEVGAQDVVREIVLPRGEISGRVRVAATGAELPQAWLVLQRRDERGWTFAGKAQADAHGAWAFASIAPGTWRVVAYAQTERLAPEPSAVLVLRPDGEGLECELALGPGAALELQVSLARGEPCAGAEVELRDARGEPWKFSPADRTDPAGHFSVGGMPPGSWSVRVAKSGCAAAERQIQLEVDQCSTLEIRLEPR